MFTYWVIRAKALQMLALIRLIRQCIAMWRKETKKNYFLLYSFVGAKLSVVYSWWSHSDEGEVINIVSWLLCYIVLDKVKPVKVWIWRVKVHTTLTFCWFHWGKALPLQSLWQYGGSKRRREPYNSGSALDIWRNKRKSKLYSFGSSVSMVTTVYKHADLTPRIVKVQIISWLPVSRLNCDW